MSKLICFGFATGVNITRLDKSEEAHRQNNKLFHVDLLYWDGICNDNVDFDQSANTGAAYDNFEIISNTAIVNWDRKPIHNDPVIGSKQMKNTMISCMANGIEKLQNKNNHLKQKCKKLMDDKKVCTFRDQSINKNKHTNSNIRIKT